MDKRAWTVAKLNFRTMGAIALAALALMIGFTLSYVGGVSTTSLQSYAYSLITHEPTIISISVISPVNALWLLPFMMAVVIATVNFRRIINLGGNRDNYFWGSLLTYIMLAGGISLITTASHFTIESVLERSHFFGEALYGGTIRNVTTEFSGAAINPVVAFIQQFSLLLLLSVFAHTLAAAQGKWYGWAANIGIAFIVAHTVYIIAPSEPIAPTLLGRFFTLISGHPSAAMQIFACLALAIVVYALNKLIFAGKAV